ncbi:MAG: arylsulfatase [Verrucomicrobiota bacterium]|nr:arylsulfatase [Verrucomicrobiota bacterium]
MTTLRTTLSHLQRRCLAAGLIALLFVIMWASVPLARASAPPSVVLIFVDDLGYGDLGSYGSPEIATPRLDRMAREGLRATSFYVASPVCSASRASLLTGRYPHRNGTTGVYFPGAKGLAHEEVTLAELLRTANYATAAIGKWHLGDQADSLPTSHGFDSYFGIPYSNDMWINPNHPIAADAVFTLGYNRERALADQAFIKSVAADRAALSKRGIKEYAPLMAGSEVIEYPADQATLTRRYFDRALDFIERTGDQPYFLFLTPAMPHVPLFATDAFLGRSRAGAYGDTVEEIDWNVGRLLDYLDQSGKGENTLVIFLSDNGPWLEKGVHAGSSGPFRDGKFSVYEGGVRVPALFRWPTRIPACSTSREMLVSTDLLPTIAALAPLPVEHNRLDGIDLGGHLAAPENPLKRPPHYYDQGGKVVGVRQGPWKYLPSGGGRFRSDTDPAELYHLGEDPAERFNLAARHPDLVAKLQSLIDERISKYVPPSSRASSRK